MFELARGVVENSFCHDFGSWVESFETDDALAVGFLEEIELWVLGVHAEGVVVGLEEVVDHLFDEFEIKDHFVIVERVGFENEFDFTRVTVWEAALVWVLGKKVAVLDLDHFANSVGHRKIRNVKVC